VSSFTGKAHHRRLSRASPSTHVCGDKVAEPYFNNGLNPKQELTCVYSLWGNPDHLKFLSTSLRERYPEDKLHVLVAKRNAGSFTYDGIELGGERVAYEIEETLEELARNGHQIKKLSVIGYSLGGLISRYALGLLFHKGLFEKIQPMVRTLKHRMSIMLTGSELHHVCHPTSGRKDAAARLAQSYLERTRRQSSFHERQAVVHY
jgi:hypothetical protein